MSDYDLFAALQSEVEDWEAIITAKQHSVDMAEAMYGAKAPGNLARARMELNNALLDLKAAVQRRDR